MSAVSRPPVRDFPPRSFRQASRCMAIRGITVETVPRWGSVWPFRPQEAAIAVVPRMGARSRANDEDISTRSFRIRSAQCFGKVTPDDEARGALTAFKSLHSYSLRLHFPFPPAPLYSIDFHLVHSVITYFTLNTRSQVERRGGLAYSNCSFHLQADYPLRRLQAFRSQKTVIAVVPLARRPPIVILSITRNYPHRLSAGLKPSKLQRNNCKNRRRDTPPPK